MVDIHSSVGWFNLSGKVLRGLADSDDVGEAPDTRATSALIDIEASIDQFVVIADQSVITLPTIEASLDAGGNLVAPADGLSATGTSAVLKLIAPQQSTISQVNWYWTIRFRPAAGNSFEPFSVTVTAAPGESKTIGGQILAGHTPSVSVYPDYIEIPGPLAFNETTGTYTFDIPDGTRRGALLAGVNDVGQVVVFIYE
jgi:hypothetical protein